MSANKKDKDVKLMKLHAEVSELYEKIPTLKEMYPIVDRIGEGKRSCFRSNSLGTFSAVYKALDKRHRFFDNSSWRDVSNTKSFMVTHPTINGQYMKTMFVALKKIYVTSSPQRLYNEINMLYQLGGKNNVIPIIEAFRQKDQLIVAMPYFEHLDFRVVMHLMDGDDLKLYMHNLLTALSHIHNFGIIHRDLKPSNFLFDLKRKRGVLVDFGLAQYEHELFGATQAAQDNIAKHNPSKKRKAEPLPPGFYTKDTRPSFKASRAGTRGFRAPEVLLKVAAQTTKLDMWSAGVIMLCLLTRQFPFFHSTDDIDAIAEIACLFGREEMEQVAKRYDRKWSTNIHTIPQKRVDLQKIWKKWNRLQKDMIESGQPISTQSRKSV
ncbi:hypothetical protein MP638_005116 [Amoeboaphelidium occidentale]|nr:hypothetical protein MP638_005116 [Amoeboaphelidium occidentale]